MCTPCGIFLYTNTESSKSIYALPGRCARVWGSCSFNVRWHGTGTLHIFNHEIKNSDASFFFLLHCLLFSASLVQKLHMHTSACVRVLLLAGHAPCVQIYTRAAWLRSRPERLRAMRLLLGLLCAELLLSSRLCHYWDVPLSLPASRSASYAAIRPPRSLSGASAVSLHHYIAAQLKPQLLLRQWICAALWHVSISLQLQKLLAQKDRHVMWSFVLFCHHLLVTVCCCFFGDCRHHEICHTFIVFIALPINHRLAKWPFST